MDVLIIILTLLCPPLGVFMKRGLGTDFFINLLLTILFFVPGLIHGIYLLMKDS
ncbi:MAG: YqaE/Pmp3 family membrane protein [Waddliaceae bacterium]|nr:YqaE/Pmp3 family membrane protein [Waddliaceae bacterium]